MKPTTGARLGNGGSTTEVIVIRPPAGDVDLTCGGLPLAPLPVQPGDAIAPDGPGSLVGKRYVHPESGMELLCTKAGTGQLRVGDEVLEIKQARSLPSSD